MHNIYFLGLSGEHRCPFGLLVCHVLALIVLVLQVGVKNIQIHNNYVPFGQLRDLTAH